MVATEALPLRQASVSMDTFDAIDRNHNGKITREEFMQYFGPALSMNVAPPNSTNLACGSISAGTTYPGNAASYGPPPATGNLTYSTTVVPTPLVVTKPCGSTQHIPAVGGSGSYPVPTSPRLSSSGGVSALGTTYAGAANGTLPPGSTTYVGLGSFSMESGGSPIAGGATNTGGGVTTGSVILPPVTQSCGGTQYIPAAGDSGNILAKGSTYAGGMAYTGGGSLSRPGGATSSSASLPKVNATLPPASTTYVSGGPTDFGATYSGGGFPTGTVTLPAGSTTYANNNPAPGDATYAGADFTTGSVTYPPMSTTYVSGSPDVGCATYSGGGFPTGTDTLPAGGATYAGGGGYAVGGSNANPPPYSTSMYPSAGSVYPGPPADASIDLSFGSAPAPISFPSASPPGACGTSCNASYGTQGPPPSYGTQGPPPVGGRYDSVSVPAGGLLDGSIPGRDVDFKNPDLFMDDKMNWRFIADIAKSLVVIESDEKVYMEELMKIPGGAEALKWLNGANGTGGEILPPGWVQQVDPSTGKPYYVNQATGEKSWTTPPGTKTGKEAALDRVKQSIEGARTKAVNDAKQARARAVEHTKAAQDAKDLADSADAFGNVSDVEHDALVKAAQKAKEDEARADAEAKRLAELARQAQLEAQRAAEEAAKAKKQAVHHHNYCQQVAMQAEQGKRDLAARGPRDLQNHLGYQEIDTARKEMQAKQAHEAALRAAEKARNAQARAQKMQQAARPGGPITALTQAQSQVDQANQAMALAFHARKRVEGLEALIALLQGELDTARQIVPQREQEAAQKKYQAQLAVQQTQALQDEIDLHISGAGEDSKDAYVTHISPEAIEQEVQKALQEAQRSQSEAAQAAAKAQQLGEAAHVAKNNLTEATTEASLPSAEELDDDADKARLAAEQAKASADALAAAAAAGMKAAQAAHRKAGKAQHELAQQKVYTQNVVQRERQEWQRRFGDGLPDGWQAQIDPETGRTYFVSPTGERTWTKPIAGNNRGLNWGTDGTAPTEAQNEEARAKDILNQAKKAAEEADRKEAEANRLALLVAAFERAMKERSMLEQIMAQVRVGAIAAAADVEKWASMTEVATIASPGANVSMSGAYGDIGYTQGSGANLNMSGAYGGTGYTQGPGANLNMSGAYGGTGYALGDTGGVGGGNAVVLSADMFETMDRNRDGAISRDEFLSYFKGAAVSNDVRREMSGNLSEKDSATAAIFDMLDRNQNGSISREEFIKGVNLVGPGRLALNSQSQSTNLGIYDTFRGVWENLVPGY